MRTFDFLPLISQAGKTLTTCSTRKTVSGCQATLFVDAEYKCLACGEQSSMSYIFYLWDLPFGSHGESDSWLSAFETQSILNTKTLHV
ncbi:MAG: hypothetical protein ABI581_11230 [Sediminibacterium sp.]